MSPQNLTNVYNQNPTLQSNYTLQQYLDLFGGSSTGTTTPTTTTTATTTTPTTNASQGIINQNINQYQSGGGGGGGIQGLDPYSRPQGTPLNPNSFLGKTVQGVKNFGSSVVDKFFGLPGVEQGKSLISNIMDNTLVGRMAAMRNPLNPKASNYNPNLQKQIDMLEGMTGTQITGTSGNLKFTDDQMMIGRDPNSGLAKYGPGSVLSGQNVVSGFGTNDYEAQLGKYISKMLQRKTLTPFQKAKLEQAKAEVAKEIARREQETADRARARNPGVYASADKQGFTDGKGGGFGSKSTGTNEAFGNKTGRGRTGYRYGGRTSYFNGGIVSLRRR